MQKPGNVGPEREYEDTTYDDFKRSAKILGECAGRVAMGELDIGEGVLEYVELSLEELGVNAHLGTAILVMPIAKVVSWRELPIGLDELERGIYKTLEAASNRDAVLVCQAIRKMEPAGLQDPVFRDSDLGELLREIERSGISYLEWMSRGGG